MTASKGTNDKTTLVRIKKRFDEEGEPTCDGCVFRSHVIPGHSTKFCELKSAKVLAHWGAIEPGPTCPVHNPTEEAL